jgi:hypothetical protein
MIKSPPLPSEYRGPSLAGGAIRGRPVPEGEQAPQSSRSQKVVDKLRTRTPNYVVKRNRTDTKH